MRALLGGKRARALDLLNYGLAMVDDELDLSDDPLGGLRYFQGMFQQSYSGASLVPSTQTEQAVVDLGCALNELVSAPILRFADRAAGRRAYEDVLSFWKMEERNFQRKGRVLDRATLDEINSGIGAFVASQFLYLLDSPRVFNEFAQLAQTYGLAVKLADNLCDFREDISRGFVNIPQEDIHQVSGISIEDGRVIQVEPEKLALSGEYVDEEHQRIEGMFASADRLMLFARARRPIWAKGLDERLCLFGQFCHSWLDQARDFSRVDKGGK